MSVTLILSREHGIDEATSTAGITLEEWLRVVERDEELRLREADLVAVNPGTGEKISVPVSPGASEFWDGGKWVPFLEHRWTELVMRYVTEFSDPANSVRKKVAEVAGKLGAVIRTDAGDEALEW